MEYKEDLVKSVISDFENRRKERLNLERIWQLCQNFLAGNQYKSINALGNIEDDDVSFYWQGNRVFNHIAPAIESRLAKLAKIRPSYLVRASSEEEKDKNAAKISLAVLNATKRDIALDKIVSHATAWSETCGSVFYKIVWDGESGNVVASDGTREVHEGNVFVSVVPPFEIYPENMSIESVEEQPSIIHSKVMKTSEILEKYGVKVEGRGITTALVSPVQYSGAATSHVQENSEIVIEKYVKPTAQFPNGRLIIVAGEELVYAGDLPFFTDSDGKRGYPFVMQKCLNVAGSFFGASVVERLIPVQRAYNAVRNRKQEFLNRLTCGVIAVEDGSVDVNDLMEEGLAPGKVIVYRQGSTAPQMLTLGSVPSAFLEEENMLIKEFALISGISESDGYRNANITSATGLQILLEQEDERVLVSADNLKDAYLETGKHILRLYRQFCGSMRVAKVVENSDVKTIAFSSEDITSEDIVLEINEISDTVMERRSVIYELAQSGLLEDDNGKISQKKKSKLLEMMGLASLA